MDHPEPFDLLGGIDRLAQDVSDDGTLLVKDYASVPLQIDARLGPIVLDERARDVWFPPERDVARLNKLEHVVAVPRNGGPHAVAVWKLQPAAARFLGAVLAAGLDLAAALAVDFLAADAFAGVVSGSAPAVFLAAATEAFSASIRSSTLAAGSAWTISISSPAIFASTTLSTASRYASENSSGVQSPVSESI